MALNNNNRYNLIGRRFGRLVVKEFIEIKNMARYWLCQCDCGNITNVSTGNLNSGRSIACGCLVGIRHGLRYHPLYNVWDKAIQRCHNPKHPAYKYYGGRGIVVCEKWRNSPVAFIEDCLTLGWQLGLQIDRIDNNGNYELGNIRFVTSKENMRNTRRNRFIEYNGERLTIAALAEKYAIITPSVVRHRLNKGWDVERALTEIKHERSKKHGTSKSKILS